MTRAILAHEATVKTATVDVRALTVSGRQVTLSVFRQLKDEEVLDQDTGDLRGVPWGVVNYFWGGCAKAAEHLHVVWQKGDQLRRACVYPRPESTAGHRAKQARIDHLFHAYALASTALDPSRSGIEWDLGDGYRYVSGEAKLWVRDRWLSANFSSDQKADLRPLLNWESHQPHRSKQRYDPDRTVWVDMSDEEHTRLLDEAWSRFADPLLAEAKRITGVASPDTMMDAMIEAVGGLADFEQRWRDQYGALADLDHLFIAV